MLWDRIIINIDATFCDPQRRQRRDLQDNNSYNKHHPHAGNNKHLIITMLFLFIIMSSFLPLSTFAVKIQSSSSPNANGESTNGRWFNSRYQRHNQLGNPSKIYRAKASMNGYKMVMNVQFIGTQVFDMYNMRVRWSEPNEWRDGKSRLDYAERNYDLKCWIEEKNKTKMLFHHKIGSTYQGYNEKFRFPPDLDIYTHCGVRAVNAIGNTTDWKYTKPLRVKEIPVYMPGLEGIDMRGLSGDEIVELLAELAGEEIEVPVFVSPATTHVHTEPTKEESGTAKTTATTRKKIADPTTVTQIYRSTTIPSTTTTTSTTSKTSTSTTTIPRTTKATTTKRKRRRRTTRTPTRTTSPRPSTFSPSSTRRITKSTTPSTTRKPPIRTPSSIIHRPSSSTTIVTTQSEPNIVVLMSNRSKGSDQTTQRRLRKAKKIPGKVVTRRPWWMRPPDYTVRPPSAASTSSTSAPQISDKIGTWWMSTTAFPTPKQLPKRPSSNNNNNNNGGRPLPKELRKKKFDSVQDLAVEAWQIQRQRIINRRADRRRALQQNNPFGFGWKALWT